MEGTRELIESIQTNLEEASLSRLYQHTKDKNSFAIIGSQDKDTKQDRSRELMNSVYFISSKYPDIGFNHLEGKYEYETGEHGIEKSLIIYNIPKQEALTIAGNLNQESIIWKDENFFGFLKSDGSTDGTFNNEERNMTFDEKITSLFGSRLKGDNREFAFECEVIEIENVQGSTFSKQNKANIKRYPVCKIGILKEDN